MAEQKKVGDDGFSITSETQEAADFADFQSYKSLRQNMKYTHKEALDSLTYSEEEFQKLKSKFEPTDEMLS